MAEELKGQALKDRAAELDIDGRSEMKADELREAIAAKEAEQAEKPTTGHESEASDHENPEVVSNLSPEGQEALSEMDEVEAELADLALDASGPLHLESPDERIMTGAVNEEHAELQAERSEISEDNPHAGHVSEAGAVPAEREEKSAEDVIDFLPPLGAADDSPEGALEPNPAYTGRRLYAQKAVMDTTGLGGAEAATLEHAYDLPEVRAGRAAEAAEERAEQAEEMREEDEKQREEESDN